MSRLWGDHTPRLDDVRPVIDLLVSHTKGTRWHHALAQQAASLRGVAGSSWYVELILNEGIPPLPDETPNPCVALNTRDGVNPWGTLFLWLDRRTRAMACIEYAAVEMADVRHYPRADELELNVETPSASDLRRAARAGRRDP